MTTHKAEIDYCRGLVRALSEANSFEDATVIVVDARNDSAQNVLNAVRREVEALKVVSDARLTKAIELADAYESVKAENERLRAERSLFLEQRDKSAAAHQETRAQLSRLRAAAERRIAVWMRHPSARTDLGFCASELQDDLDCFELPPFPASQSVDTVGVLGVHDARPFLYTVWTPSSAHKGYDELAYIVDLAHEQQQYTAVAAPKHGSFDVDAVRELLARLQDLDADDQNWLLPEVTRVRESEVK